jgi:hypothetical protein
MKKKILETSMLLYQYLYYDMRYWDKQLGLPASFTKFKIPILVGVFETFILLTIYDFIDNIIFGHRIFGLPIHEIPSSVIGACVYALVLCYVNQRILGPDRQIEHYKKIFDAWDKWKHRRWCFYTWAIMAVIAFVFFAVCAADQNGLHPKKWIDDMTETIWSHLTE